MTKRALFLSLLMLFFTILANADPIGGPGSSTSCPTCFDVTYTLTAAEIGNDPTMWAITLNVDASTYDGTATNLLNAVAPKVVSSSTDITAFNLVSVSGTGNALTDWNTGLGGLNANGCQTPQPQGFLCSNWTGTGFGLQVGSTGDVYDWTWDITILPGTLFTGDMQATIKALYVTDTGKHQGLTSAPITLQGSNLPPPPPTPEPASLLLLGSGLLGGGALLRRYKKL